MTPQESPLKRFLLDCGTRDAVAAPGLFVLRVATGLMMLIGHGLPHLRDFADLKNTWYVPNFFPFYFMTPPISLIATIGAEVGAAALLIAGLLTRPAAFVFCFAMVVAGFDVCGGAPWFAQPATGKELAVLYLIPGMVLLLTGAGGWSLDAVLLREAKRRRW